MVVADRVTHCRSGQSAEGPFEQADVPKELSNVYTFLSARNSAPGIALTLRVAPIERAYPVTPAPVLSDLRPYRTPSTHPT